MIGNPPYISAPAQVDNEVLNRQRDNIIKSKQYKSLYLKWDLYIPFMEKGLQMLTDKGIFTMIVPYPLTNQGYAKLLRSMMVNDYCLYEVVDLNGTKIFENATVSNCIPFVGNGGKTESVTISHITPERNIIKDSVLPIESFVQSDKLLWNTENKVLRGFDTGYTLGDFCYISKGMVLNADEKTARGEFSKDDLISNTKDAIHSRAYIEAKDIEPYHVKRLRYLEWDTERCPGKLSRPTFREMYNCQKLMINRLGKLQVYFDAEDKLLHSDSMFSAILWQDLSRVENNSISGSIRKFSKHSRSEMEELSGKVTLKYLLAILNSSFADELLAFQRGGDYHIYPEHLRQLPIPIAPTEIQERLAELVDKIILKDNVTESQDEIDRIVRNLYE